MKKIIDPRDSRAYTCAVLELVDEGVLDKDNLIQDLLGWLSEGEVRDFCKRNLRDEDNDCIICTEDEADEADEEDDEDEDEVERRLFLMRDHY